MFEFICRLTPEDTMRLLPLVNYHYIKKLEPLRTGLTRVILPDIFINGNEAKQWLENQLTFNSTLTEQLNAIFHPVKSRMFEEDKGLVGDDVWFNQLLNKH